MFIHKWELLAIIAIFGFAWAVLPWEPLSTLEGMLAGFYLLIISGSIVALAESAFEAVTGRKIPG